MANSKTNTSKKKTQNTKSATKKTQAKKPASQTSTRKKAAPAPAPIIEADNRSGAADYFHAFSKSRFFKPLVNIVIVLAVIGLDLLISWNKYDRFFGIVGIEIIIVALVLAIKLAMSTNKETEKKEE